MYLSGKLKILIIGAKTIISAFLIDSIINIEIAKIAASFLANYNKYLNNISYYQSYNI